MMGKLALAFSKRIPNFGATTLATVCVFAVSASAFAAKKIEMVIPAEPTPEGAVFIASVASSDEMSDVNGVFQGHVIEFFPEGDHTSSGAFHRYSAVIGVEYGTKPGPVDLSVSAKVAGENVEQHIDVIVKAGVFPSEKLKVPPKTVFPSARQMRIIKSDNVAIAHAYATKTTTKFWDPPGVMPVDNEVTSAFGTFRVYNGRKQKPHLGTDFRAAAGTPILVPFTGQVVLARKLFLTGNTVILDHGFGVFTIYGHMSRLKCKVGDIVKKGEIMGLAGATGRASGPHLHWGVSLHGTKVEPRALFQVLNNGARTNPIARSGG